MTTHSYKSRNHFNTNRTFGVEIETKNLVRDRFVRQCTAEGIRMYDTGGYTHGHQHTWKIVTDASLGIGGLEIVSPPLAGVEGLEEVAKVMRIAVACNATVDSSCGFHVHHGCGEYTPEQAAGVLLWYAKYEPVIDSLVAPSRRQGNVYCASLRKATDLITGIQWVLDGARRNRTMANLSTWFADTRTSGVGRYHKVNLASWANYGTIEFRQHQGTLNGEKAKAWIIFTQRIVERGARGRIRVTEPSRMDFAEVIRMLGMQDSQTNGDPVIAFAREYLKRRIDQLAARIARSARNRA